MGAKIEIFADDSPAGQAFIQRVETLACSKCEITIYNVNDVKEEVQMKGKRYGITKYPAVVMNGKVVTLPSVHPSDTSSLYTSEYKPLGGIHYEQQ